MDQDMAVNSQYSDSYPWLEHLIYQEEKSQGAKDEKPAFVKSGVRKQNSRTRAVVANQVLRPTNISSKSTPTPQASRKLPPPQASTSKIILKSVSTSTAAVLKAHQTANSKSLTEVTTPSNGIGPSPLPIDSAHTIEANEVPKPNSSQPVIFAILGVLFLLAALLGIGVWICVGKRKKQEREKRKYESTKWDNSPDSKWNCNLGRLGGDSSPLPEKALSELSSRANMAVVPQFGYSDRAEQRWNEKPEEDLNQDDKMVLGHDGLYSGLDFGPLAIQTYPPAPNFDPNGASRPSTDYYSGNDYTIANGIERYPMIPNAIPPMPPPVRSINSGLARHHLGPNTPLTKSNTVAHRYYEPKSAIHHAFPTSSSLDALGSRQSDYQRSRNDGDAYHQAEYYRDPGGWINKPMHYVPSLPNPHSYENMNKSNQDSIFFQTVTVPNRPPPAIISNANYESNGIENQSRRRDYQNVQVKKMSPAEASHELESVLGHINQTHFNYESRTNSYQSPRLDHYDLKSSSGYPHHHLYNQNLNGQSINEFIDLDERQITKNDEKKEMIDNDHNNSNDKGKYEDVNFLPLIEPSPSLLLFSKFDRQESNSFSPTFTNMNQAFESPPNITNTNNNNQNDLKDQNEYLRQVNGNYDEVYLGIKMLPTNNEEFLMKKQDGMNQAEEQDKEFFKQKEVDGSHMNNNHQLNHHQNYGFVPLEQMNLNNNQGNYRSATLSVYDMYRKTPVVQNLSRF